MQHNYEHVSFPTIAVIGMGKSLSYFRKRLYLTCLLFNQEYKKVMLVFKNISQEKAVLRCVLVCRNI